MRDYKVISTTVPANITSYSGEVDLGSATAIAIETPDANFDVTTLTFQSKSKQSEQIQSGDNIENWKDVYDDEGNEFSLTVAENRIVTLKTDEASILAPLRFLRVRLGTSGAPDTTNTQAVIKFIVK